MPSEDANKEMLGEAIEKFKGERELSLIFRGLPVKLKQSNLKEWLSPIRMKSVSLLRSPNETFAFVTFNRGSDMKKALLRTDQFLGGYKVNNTHCPL